MAINSKFFTGTGSDAQQLNGETTIEQVVGLADALANLVPKVSGYGLSKNDFTDLLLSKLNSLENYDDTTLSQSITTLQSRLDTLVSGNATTAIDSFNEITNFLSHITDSTTLEGIIAGINSAITDERNRALAAENAIIASMIPQSFASPAMTNPFLQDKTPRRVGDVAINTTSGEIWTAIASAGAESSWEITTQGLFGGTLITDVHSITKNGFYSITSTGTNIPTADESFYILAMCSNLSTTSAILTVIGLTSGKMYMKRKVSNVWGNYVGGITQTELSYMSGATGNIQAQFSNLTNEINKKINKSVGTNLFNPNGFVSGSYITSGGGISTNATWGITDFIPLKQADANIVSNFFAPLSSGGYNALYDTNKNFIASFQGNTATWQTNVAYVRFSGTPLVATNTIMVNVGTVLQTLVPYTETKGLVSTESLVDGSITTQKVKDGAITGAKLETDYKNLLVQKYVKQSDTTTKYLNRVSGSTIIYPNSEGYGWAMTVVPTVQMVVNGAVIKPTKTMTGVLLCVLQLPDDISGTPAPSGTITVLQEVDITKKWNENIGVETEFYFDSATLLVGKNYAIGYRDANLSTHIGFYDSPFITGMSQVRPRITSVGGIWYFASNSTSVPFVVPGLFDVVKVKTGLNANKSIEGREIADGTITEEKTADNIISTQKVKDGAITGAKLETDYKNLLVQKYVKQSDTTTKYLNRVSGSTIIYPNSEGYGWAMTVVPTVQMVVNGAVIKPTKTMTGVLLCVLQLPDDISGTPNQSGTITVLQEVDITKKWNENIGVETEFYFDSATLLVGKNYAIGYRDANLSTHVGFYDSSFISGMSQVRQRITSVGGIWVFTSNSTSVPFVVPGLFDVVKVKTSLNADGSIEGKEIVDNSISTSKLKDGAVTPIKTNFFQASKNLFNLNDSDVALGYYVGYEYGNLSVNETYNATGYIPVVGGQNYTMSYKHQMAWYDSNKVYISGSSSSDTNPTQQAPANAAFARCTVIKTLWSSFQFELGTQQTSYEPYGFKIKQEYIPESDSYFPNIAMTRKLHILANNENSVYHKSLIERWNPYRYLIQSTGTNWGYYERYSRVNAASAGDITYEIYDGVTLSLKQTKTATVVVGNPATNNGAKIVQVIGDSFSYNGYWFDKTNQLCPALSFVGMRKSYNTLLKAEGRGGWTLALYMTSKHAANDSFSPFLHPVDPYKYYGNTAFWIAVKTGSGDYGIAGFTDIANSIGFDSVTGFKTSPSANDVMYNDVNARYEVYNGSAWVEISESTLSFTFNYGKYLTTWGISMPDIVGIMLGANDFRTTVLTDATFTTWKNNMDMLLTSVRNAAAALGKTVKIAICLPTTETASANNSASINPVFQRANMYDARRRIIEAFDNDTYSNNNVDVVDTGTAVDGDFGFDMSEIKPFSDYAGTQREMYSNNVPHPNNGGYGQLGVRFAGYIQSIR